MGQQALTRTEQQALAKPEINPIAQLFERWSSDKYILLAPITHIEEMPEGMKIVVTEVKVNTHKGAREVYPDPGGGLMLAKIVLNKISIAAGISWTAIRRMDDGRHPYLFHIEVKGSMTDFDGTTRQLCDAKCTDLREDAGAGIMGKDYRAIVTKNEYPDKQLMEARIFNAEITTSKARNRAISGGLAIHRSYSKKELDDKSFIIPKLTLDTKDPESRRMAKLAAAGAATMLFGNPQIIDQPFIEVEPTDIQPVGETGAEAGGAEDHSTSAPSASSGEEQTGTSEVLAAVRDAWARATKAEMTPAAFRKLCETNTGKARKEDMTLAEAKAVARAVEAYIESNDPSDDGCPV